VLGWLRSEPTTSVSRTTVHDAIVAKTPAPVAQPSRKPVSNSTLNMLLLAMFSSASRMDSFGNFR
jgi:hypothetical protein